MRAQSLKLFNSLELKGASNDDLLTEIAAIDSLLPQLVGNLYPQILLDKKQEMLDELANRKLKTMESEVCSLCQNHYQDSGICDEGKRFILVCQVHGWFSTTHDLESAIEFQQLHLHDEHPPEFDGEIIITKELT